MEYKKLILKSIPKVRFAHNHRSSQYDLTFGVMTNALEVSYIDKGDVKRLFRNGKEELIPQESVVVHLFDRDLRMWSDSQLHSHCTVGIGAEFRSHPIGEMELLKESRAFSLWENKLDYAIIFDGYFPHQKGGRIHALIEKITYNHASIEYGKELYCSGLVLELLAELTQEAVKNAYFNADSSLSPVKILYCEQATQYILWHIREKITIDDIADHIGISAGYLSNTFKAVRGQTIGEYIMMTKMNYVKEYLTSRKTATLREAAQSVGIKDENYLSRIFKQHTGMTVTEFRAQKEVVR